MKTRILIASLTRVGRGSVPALRRCATFFLARAAERGLHIEDLSIALTDDAGIAPLNRQFVGHDGPTDVISFLLARPPGHVAATGEVILNVEQALREARRRRLDPSRELAWYLAHGIHHLTGADDSTPAKRAAMHRAERGWVAAAAKQGLLLNLLEARA